MEQKEQQTFKKPYKAAYEENLNSFTFQIFDDKTGKVKTVIAPTPIGGIWSSRRRSAVVTAKK